MNKPNLPRNLEICKRHFEGEKLGYKKLSKLYNVRPERIREICQGHKKWLKMAVKQGV